MSETSPFEGCYRRVIDLKAWDEHTVVGWLEDDLHHFGLTLIHDGRVVTDVHGAARRYPWTTCPGAVSALADLIGKPLVARCTDVGRQIEMRQQCTHLFDLVGLLSAHAFHRRDHRRYHATVEVLGEHKARSPWRRAILRRDGVPVMSWDLEGNQIRVPAEFGGQSMDRGFRPWTESLDEEPAEQATVLRRAVFVSGARFKESRIEAIPGPSEVPVVCHSYRLDIREGARRDAAAASRRFDQGDGEMVALVNSKP